MAALVALAAGGCKGEEALYARDAAAFVMLGSGGDVGKGGTSGQGGSVGTGGAGNKGGVGGMAGGGAGGQAGSGTGGQPTGHFGDFCQSTGDCLQGSCQSHFCCATGTNCSATCQTCDTNGTTCVPVKGALGDPRGDCAPMATSKDMCGIEGNACNGSGACVLWPAGTPCSNASTCSGTDKVNMGSICDGQGFCKPNAPVSCNSFLCESSAGAGDAGAIAGCLTTCGKDTDCVSGGFCGAASCVGPTPNLAGNGDAEYGTHDGWFTVQQNGAQDSVTTAAVHNGTYSILDTARAASYQGPGYYIPTGQGQYNVSFWAMQNQYPSGSADAGASTPPSGDLQLAIVCGMNTIYYLQGGTGALPKGTWVNFSTTFDTSNPNPPTSVPPDCFPDGEGGLSAPGLVRSAIVFLQSGNGPTDKMPFPNLYIDDLVVTVPDAATHNLDGNPGFESGAVGGWQPNGVGSGSSLGVSGTKAHSGTMSLQQTGRTNVGTGLKYPMMIGAADYNISLWATQSGTAPGGHNLLLQAVYTCLGDSAVYQDNIDLYYGATTWVKLFGVYAFPPHHAPPGCKLTSASLWVTQADGAGLTCGAGTGQVECPDLFIDDLSILLTNQTAPL